MRRARRSVRCKFLIGGVKQCLNRTYDASGICHQHRLIRQADRAKGHIKPAFPRRGFAPTAETAKRQDPATGRPHRQMRAEEIAGFVTAFLRRTDNDAAESGRPSEGGFTQPPGIDEHTGLPLPPPEVGIAVALNGSRLDIDITVGESPMRTPDTAEIDEQLIEWSVDMNPVFATGEAFMGGWYGQSEGSLEVNVTLVFHPGRRAEAEQFAAEEHQVAAFDLGQGEQIDTGGSGETGWREAREADTAKPQRQRRGPAPNGNPAQRWLRWLTRKNETKRTR